MPFHFEPPLLSVQAAAIVLIALAAFACVSFAAVLRSRSPRAVVAAALRLLLAALLAAIFLNPVSRISSAQSRRKSPFALLFDTSHSMENRDVSAASSTSGGPTRWQTAQRTVLENTRLLAALSHRYDLRLFRFDAQLSDTSLNEIAHLPHAMGGHTGIGEALTQVAGSMDMNGTSASAGGILVISDGQDNGGIDPIDAAHATGALGAPVYTYCIGRETRTPAIRLIAQNPRLVTAPGQSVEIVGEIRAGSPMDRRVRVDLLREGRRVRSQIHRLSDSTTRVAFTVEEPNPGVFRYTLSCASDPAGGAANSPANVEMHVTAARAQVLLLEGFPSWDARFLARTLQEDPSVSLDTIYQLTDTHRFALSGGSALLHVPKTQKDFERYDIVVLGKGAGAFLDANTARVLQKWVGDRGGNLVFLRGRADDLNPALQALEPVELGEGERANARVRLTEAGRAFPGFQWGEGEAAPDLEDMPPLLSIPEVTKVKALAVVLARGVSGPGGGTSEIPLIVSERYGQGTVLAILGQGFWQWAFQPPGRENVAHVYNDFWMHSIRWLTSSSEFAPGENVGLRTDRGTYTRGETATIRGFLRGDASGSPITLTIHPPNGAVTEIRPTAGDGRTADFTASFPLTETGQYTVSATLRASRSPSAITTFSVGEARDEESNPSADPGLMRRIAAAGGGKALSTADLAGLPDRLRITEQASSETREPRTLWDRGWVIAVLLSLLTGDWLIRRK